MLLMVGAMGIRTSTGSVCVGSMDGLSGVASSSRCTSSLVRPFPSRKETLRSVEAARISSSSRNFEAFSSSASLEEDFGTSSLGESGVWNGPLSFVLGLLGCRCHVGMEGGFGSDGSLILDS